MTAAWRILVFVAAILAASATYGQHPSFTIRGKVTGKGGFVPIALVTLENKTTGQTQTTTTDRCGTYVFEGIDSRYLYDITATYGTKHSKHFLTPFVPLRSFEQRLDLSIPDVWGEWCMTGNEDCLDRQRKEVK